MITFFSDLDNTLIYSHHREITGNKRPAEMLNGKIQSYMTEQTYSFLKKADFMHLIPITTRTAEQYSRIFIFDDIPCKTALVCNGGILLKNGRSDAKWREETLQSAKGELSAVENAFRLLIKSVDPEHVHFPEPFFVYAKCVNPQEIAEDLIRICDISDFADINYDSRKIYCTAKSVTKGNALLRYKKRFGIERCIAAGDSSFDISMLNCADIAFVSDEISDRISAPEIYTVGNGIISDKICKIINELRNRGYFDD